MSAQDKGGRRDGGGAGGMEDMLKGIGTGRKVGGGVGKRGGTKTEGSERRYRRKGKECGRRGKWRRG